MWGTPCDLPTSAFFYIICDYFDFNLVFQGYLNHHNYNFEDFSNVLIKVTLLENIYDVIILVYDVCNKTIWHDSNSVVDMIIWKNFGKSIFSVKVIITSVLSGFDQKNIFYGEMVALCGTPAIADPIK